jgi:shikimate kinase
MTRSAAAAARHRHVVFVGVAAVGKTTLGALTAPLIAMPFADTDLTMERWHAVTIEELSQEPDGDGRINKLLWQTYQALVQTRRPTLIAAPPRLLGRSDFWQLTHEHAVSIHLRSKPLRVLRQALALEKQRTAPEVHVSDSDRARFYEYYWWRLRHCQHADHEFRLSGDLEADATALGAAVRQILGG